VRVFPCAVNLASSVIALVSEDKISSGDLRQGIIFRATKQNSGSERIHPIGHGPSSADVTKIGPIVRARSAQAAGRPPSTRQRVKNNCNPHMGP
jgi:hypothetical protein